MKRKRLFWDVETCPDVGFFWQPSRRASISYDNIVFEREIICICYKWEGEEEVYSLDWTDGEKKMLETFLPIINDATESIAHNGDNYDLPFLRGRCLYHRIPMFPEYSTIDTLKWVKGKTGFRFNSNRLDYIGKFLGYEGKSETNYGMWKTLTIDRFIKKQKEAKDVLKEMVEYCENDVRLLEYIFAEINNYKKHSFNYAVASNVSDADNKWRCPECVSSNVYCNKTNTTRMGTVRRQMVCKDCKKNYTISNKNYEHFLVWKTTRKNYE